MAASSLYGSLGYIDSGRRAPHRDAYFSGSTGNPAKKELQGARRVEDSIREASKAAVHNPAAAITAAEKVHSNNTANAPSTVKITPPLASHVLEKRCVFLEEQNRQCRAEIAELRSSLADLATQASETRTQHKYACEQVQSIQADMTEHKKESTSDIIGHVVKDTWQLASQPVQGADVSDLSSAEVVKAGTTVRLVYPMTKIYTTNDLTQESSAQIWMSRVEVCPRLATVCTKWILIFEEVAGEPPVDKVFVTNFA